MEKPKRRRTDQVVPVPSVAPRDLPATMTHREIARRAYELYEERGGEHGHDLDDWLQAERELQDLLRSTAA
jgi:hypothetical protein